jgi:hypothetical protein
LRPGSNSGTLVGASLSSDLKRHDEYGTLLTITQLLRTGLAYGAVGFKLRSGRHPVIYSKKGVQTYDTQASTPDDVEALLRELMSSSRQMRQFRETGLIYFRSAFEGVAVFCAARMDGEEIRVELRRLAAF